MAVVYEGVSRRARSWDDRLVGEIGVLVLVAVRLLVEAAGDDGGDIILMVMVYYYIQYNTTRLSNF